jgi:hypothetical protein
VAAGVFICPLLHSVKHVPLDLDLLVSESGMMESPDKIIYNFIDRNSGILPGIEDATSDHS